MIRPEPIEFRYIDHSNTSSCRAGRHGWCTHETVAEIPAAGHLGIIEEKCELAHGRDYSPEPFGFPCPGCGGAV